LAAAELVSADPAVAAEVVAAAGAEAEAAAVVAEEAGAADAAEVVVVRTITVADLITASTRTSATDDARSRNTPGRCLSPTGIPC